MLFDIGWPELMLIGVVALVVIGPKDLPRALRVAGTWVRKARLLSREFQGSVEQMIRDAELEEMRRDLQKATEINLEHELKKTVDPDGSLTESIRAPAEIPDFFETPPQLAGGAATAAQPGDVEVAEGSGETAAEGATDETPLLPGLDLPPAAPPAPELPLAGEPEPVAAHEPDPAQR